MGAAPKLGAWGDVMVGDLELDSFGGEAEYMELASAR